MRYSHILFLVSSALLGACAANAGVESYTCAEAPDGTLSLTSVSVEIGGTVRIYASEKLVPAKVVHHYAAGGVHAALPPGADAATTDWTGLLDAVFSSAVANSGAMDHPAPGAQGPGTAVRFTSPLVNRPGVDAVLFELHKGTKEGDPFHLAPLAAREGLHGITVDRYDIPPGHPSVLSPSGVDLFRFKKNPQGIQDLIAAEPVSFASNEAGFAVLAVGIDLSALGYGEGETVEGLVFRSVAGKSAFDPAAVVGLPEPVPANLLAEAPPHFHHLPGKLLTAALKGPLAGCDEIVFAERVSGVDHWYGNFGHYCGDKLGWGHHGLTVEGDRRYPFADGGRLCRLNLRTGEVTVILDDPKGGVRDPHVHYDGQKILFSYRKGGTKPYHLYEIGIDGTGLTQLTDGPDNDIEPIYTPEGNILFCSSRCHRFVPCWVTQVATLYRCDADGSNIRMVSNNAEQENTPWMLPDGRVLYMRWEYVDRNQLLYHHLWTINPDGTGVMVYFGNQHNGLVMIDAKPIPNTDKIVASFSPGHGKAEHMGRITIVDPKRGPDEMSMAHAIGKRDFRDPYPLSEDLFLVADGGGIHLLGADGSVERICSPTGGNARLQCHEPRPLRSRKREKIITNRIAEKKTTGTLVLSDMYEGRNMAGVERGSIKKLLVLEQLPKPANFSGGQEPLTVGGTFTLQRILGTVPVEEDGSAHIEVPALRSLFFVALDENNLGVKRMQSFVTVQPGEQVSCVGCHEPRTQAPHARSANSLKAVRRAPSLIEPCAGIPDVLDFPRDIQPIFDKHCVSCHNHDRQEGKVNLSGNHTPYYSTAYWTMFSKGLAMDGRNKHGNRAPYTVGSCASPLMKYLKSSHYDVKLSPRELELVRLWIDSGATYSGTYAALGSGMFPVDFPEETIIQRCGGCHKAKEKTYRNFKKGAYYFQFGEMKPPQPLLKSHNDIILVRHLAYFQMGEAPLYQALCNLDDPAKSRFLRAPLARSAGGLECCGEPVFADTNDPAYQKILAAIESASRALHEHKRFDMAGFRPNRYYVREMQFYGILPDSVSPEEAIDPYVVDQQYWKSFIYAP